MSGRPAGRPDMPDPLKALYRGSAKHRARLPGQSASEGSLLAELVDIFWMHPKPSVSCSGGNYDYNCMHKPRRRRVGGLRRPESRAVGQAPTG